MIRVAVTGAYGKMGREVVKTVLRAEDMELVGAIDSAGEGTDVGTLVEAGNTGIVIEKDLDEVLARVRPDVAVDFTNPHCVFGNALIYLKHRVRPVIGTTGLSPEQIDEIIGISAKHKVGGLIAPNVAIGALLMMRFAAEASRYLPNVEIIELHHDQKLDAPSGTAIKTAEGILEQRDPAFRQGLAAEIEKVPGARGGAFDGGIRIHSVRLPVW